MKASIKDFEIMAPVGSRESLAAAIQAGADSIYFGIESLNMRARSASTFTVNDLREIAQICDKHGIRSLELSAFRCILNLSCHPYRHLLVNLAGCREQRWYHVNLLCLVNQVVWVYRDAVAANESWSSWHEVPFCASCRRYVFDVAYFPMLP